MGAPPSRGRENSVSVVHQTQLHGSFVRRFGDLGETGGERERKLLHGGRKEG